MDINTHKNLIDPGWDFLVYINLACKNKIPFCSPKINKMLTRAVFKTQLGQKKDIKALFLNELVNQFKLEYFFIKNGFYSEIKNKIAAHKYKSRNFLQKEKLDLNNINLVDLTIDNKIIYILYFIMGVGENEIGKILGKRELVILSKISFLEYNFLSKNTSFKPIETLKPIDWFEINQLKLIYFEKELKNNRKEHALFITKQIIFLFLFVIFFYISTYLAGETIKHFKLLILVFNNLTQFDNNSTDLFYILAGNFDNNFIFGYLFCVIFCVIFIKMSLFGYKKSFLFTSLLLITISIAIGCIQAIPYQIKIDKLAGEINKINKNEIGKIISKKNINYGTVKAVKAGIPGFNSININGNDYKLKTDIRLKGGEFIFFTTDQDNYIEKLTVV